MPRLTIFYIVEPPDYQIMACTLLASIRTHFGPDVAAIGYCPEHRMAELHPSIFKAHEIMGAEIRPMKTEGMWDEPYPHGNKIISALQPLYMEGTPSAWNDPQPNLLLARSPELAAAFDKVARVVPARFAPLGGMPRLGPKPAVTQD